MGSESLMVCVSLKVNAYLDGIYGEGDGTSAWQV